MVYPPFLSRVPSIPEGGTPAREATRRRSVVMQNFSYSLLPTAFCLFSCFLRYNAPVTPQKNLFSANESVDERMKFYEIVEQVRTLLQREGRVSYRVLKREFALDDEDLEDLKSELIDAKRVAVDEDGKVLVWIGSAEVISSQLSVPSSTQPLTPSS
jgi:hypothetical protein